LDIDNEQLVDAFLKIKIQNPNRKKKKSNGEVYKYFQLTQQIEKFKTLSLKGYDKLLEKDQNRQQI